MIDDRFDLAAKVEASWVERFASNRDAQAAISFLNDCVTPDESLYRKKIEQFRKEVVHQVGVGICRNGERPLFAWPEQSAVSTNSDASASAARRNSSPRVYPDKPASLPHVLPSRR
jgi:hypothetical protein